MAAEPSKPFRVIIAGAGIAGLALANCLELAGINYILLEERDVVIPSEGAGVYLASGSGPTVEQLGLKQKLRDIATPYHHWGLHWPNGDYVYEPTADLLLSERRAGYGRAMADRSEILKIFYDNLSASARAERVLTHKKITGIECSPASVTARCVDGSTYSGDLLIGADGVHGKIRTEMLRIANEADQSIPLDDQKPDEITYGCLYGIANPIEGTMHTTVDLIPDKGHCIIWSKGKDESIFFRNYYKLPKPVMAGDFNFTDADMDALAVKMQNKPLMPNGSLGFRDLWRNRKSVTLVPIESGEHKTTTWGRVAILGSSVHKQTVSAGEDGDLCIESAALLTNTLNRLIHETQGRPSYDDLRVALRTQYMDSRAERISAYLDAVNGHTALITQANLFKRFFSDFSIPHFPPDLIADFFSSIEVGADMLDFVPPPKGALLNTMPYNKLVGCGRRESLWSRAFVALPLLGIFVLAAVKLNPFPAFPELESIYDEGFIELDGKPQPIFHSFYGIASLDKLLATLSIYFSGWTLGLDGPGSWQAYQFLTDFGLLYAIMLVESTRRANRLALSSSALLWGFLGQRLGIGLVGQLYFFFHYIGSQMDNYKALDMRLTDVRHTSTIPVSIFAHYIPLGLAFAAPIADSTRYWWSWVWQLFPLWIALTQRFLALFIRDTTFSDKLYSPTRDLPAIHVVVQIIVAISTGTWLYTVSQSPYSLREMYIPQWEVPTELWANARNFLAWDYICCFSGALFWMLLLFKDLKKWEKVEQNWVQLLIMMGFIGAITGPGATLGLGWLWREELLADKKMKGALVPGSWQPPKYNVRARGVIGTAKSNEADTVGPVNRDVKT